MEGILQYPVSAETGIAFEDYTRMGRENHTGAYLKNSPRWAMSDAKLRMVVAHKICITAGVGEVPATLDALRNVEENYMLATRANAAKPNAVENQKHLATVESAGGPLAFFVNLLYRRYRLGMDSPELARQFGITPQNVRQQINRCSLIARGLFPDPEDHLPWHHSANAKQPKATIAPRVFGPPKVKEPKLCIVKEPKLCIVCGKEVPKGHRKFCGKKCRREYLLAKNVPAKKPKFCIVCGKEVPKRHSKFCSEKCYIEYFHAKDVLAKKPKFCIICGAEVPKRHSKFCGKKCCREYVLAKGYAKRKEVLNPRPVLCSADCKIQYTVRQRNGETFSPVPA